MATEIKEPPDGTRFEFAYGGDIYAVWRDDKSSAATGWPVGDGGKVWCFYGDDVPITWAELVDQFGSALRTGTHLVKKSEYVRNVKNSVLALLLIANLLVLAIYSQLLLR